MPHLLSHCIKEASSATIGNPVNWIDPSGLRADCPVDRWDCEAVKNVRKLKEAFLRSASRHNRVPTMDDNGFAALVAAVMVSERRIGNIIEDSGIRSRGMQWLENLAIDLGCTVSGHYLHDAWTQRDWPRLRRYLSNQEVPAYSTVGIGNVHLDTAANPWRGQACNSLGECMPIQVNDLKTTNAIGMEIRISDPFGPQVACGLGGTCVSHEPSATESYQRLAQQLLDHEMSIEYVAANLEAGALRAYAKRLEPSAFNLAAWHMRGVQTDREIRDSGWNPGGAIYIVDDMPTALTVLQVTTRWNLAKEYQYAHWTKMGY